MTTAEYVKNIQNVSNEDLMNNLETCGHDGYYNALYYPVLKEIKRRLKYYEKEAINSLPTAQLAQDLHSTCTDIISRHVVLNEISRWRGYLDDDMIMRISIGIKRLPTAQPFHNITMNDVLKFIDGMPEDVWQEFTACLECRGWELQRRTAKWCGSEFA